MVEVYSKMKPDAFTSQFQTVLTAYYEDIKEVVSASGCTESKVVKRKFEDQVPWRSLPRRAAWFPANERVERAPLRAQSLLGGPLRAQT